MGQTPIVPTSPQRTPPDRPVNAAGARQAPWTASVGNPDRPCGRRDDGPHVRDPGWWVSEVVVREFEPSDGEALRELWQRAGFRLIGDDDAGLARFAARNPGLFLVGVVSRPGTSGEVAPGTIVASAMGAWDGHRGWIYHVTTAVSHRRTGIAATLIARIEAALAELGAPRVNVLVRDGNDAGRAFWQAAGYELAGSTQYGKPLGRRGAATGRRPDPGVDD